MEIFVFTSGLLVPIFHSRMGILVTLLVLWGLSLMLPMMISVFSVLLECVNIFPEIEGIWINKSNEYSNVT